ncbi:MAG: OmpA family protein [Ilumatobacteraceae bacterium]
MSSYAYEDDFDDERPTMRIVLCAVAVVVLSALLWFVIRPSIGGGGTTSASTVDSTATTVAVEQPTTTAAAPTTIAPVAEPTAVADSVADTTVETTIPATTAAPSVESATEPVADGATTPDASLEQAAPGASYPTLPDGSPVPVLAIFEVDTITLSGTVPSQEAADRLATLALANSKTPAAVVKFLAINPDVPANVGVRVLEMTSTRFPEASADILPAHAGEIDRIGAVMNALPNTSVLVIGHADQRGSDAANFAISEERARAVVSHLVASGIDASRLSSRAVGETDLLSLADDETAFELNRRTEFVISGLLVEA